MAEPRAAAGVVPSELGSYQHAVRLVLTNSIITARRPRAGALATVLRWADLMARDFRELFGYTLIATTHQVRLVRRLDTLDDSQQSTFTAKSGRPFDRRRLAYLCLMLAVFQRSRVEISLADLVRVFGPLAGGVDGLGFDPTITGHKRAVVDVLDWLTDHGALRLSDGSAENWARDSERGDALYDIDHDICGSLFRPARPLQHLASAAGLLDAADLTAKRSARRAAAARRARRLLVEYPVLYYALLDDETAAALRSAEFADNLARLTGLVAERRAEGVMLVDPMGWFTDLPFPGRGGAVNRAAGLLLAKIADLLEDPDDGPALTRMPLPSAAEDQQDLLLRIDTGVPAGVARNESWAPVAPVSAGPIGVAPVGAGPTGAGLAGAGPAAVGPVSSAAGAVPTGLGLTADSVVAAAPSLEAPFVERTRLEGMLDELYRDFGAASFTVQWQYDPRGLLDAAASLLADLGLIRRVPGGVLILPAAARYRNITAALPDGSRRDGQGAFDFTGLTPPGRPGAGEPPEGLPAKGTL